MDDKFRVAFVKPGSTPSAAAYLEDTALIFDRLREAVKVGRERKSVWEAPFISHKFMVIDPHMIDMLYDQVFGTS